MNKKLDYSNVEVMLYTSDGLLKHSSDCESNGYFIIPLYDKVKDLLMIFNLCTHGRL